MKKTRWYNELMCNIFRNRALVKIDKEDGSIEWDNLKPSGGPTLASWLKYGLDFRFFPITWRGRTGFYLLKDVPLNIHLVGDAKDDA